MRRSAEYHFAMLASLTGMMVLASARDLVLIVGSFALASALAAALGAHNLGTALAFGTAHRNTCCHHD